MFESLSFSMEAGDVLHITGENGAGKTSLLRLIAGFSELVEGRILWRETATNEFDSQFRKESVYLGHKLALQPNLSAIENVHFWMTLQETASEVDVYNILALFGLVGLEDLPVKMLSAGQQRRVSLSRLLCKPAKLWILDEPFTSLDKGAVAMLTDLMASHKNAGGMVLLTSHSTLPDRLHAQMLELEYQL